MTKNLVNKKLIYMRQYNPASLLKPRTSWALTVSNNSLNVKTLKNLCFVVATVR